MKTLTATQKISKFFSLSITALVAVIAMTGCGKKSNNNNVVNGYGVGQYCTTGCSGGNALIASAFGTSQLEDFYVNFVGVSATNPYQSNYQGQVTAQGIILVNANSAATCGIAQGRYSLQTTQPGAWQGASIVSPIVTVASPMDPNGLQPVQMVFSQYMYVSQSVSRSGPDGQQYAYRLRGPIYVTGQQGQRCQIDL